MNFKTKDLLVTVLPKLSPDILKACLFHTNICKNPTFCKQATCLHATFECGYCSVKPTLIPCHGSCGFVTPGCPGGSCLFESQGCPGGSCFFGSRGCPGQSCFGSQGCPGGSGDPPLGNPFVIEYMEDLVALRAELQETLKQLDAIQKEGLPSGISSKAEAEALEQSLSEALQQVRTAKGKLK